MPRFMLDTNICIFLRRQRPVGLLRRFEKLDPEDVCISAVTYGELRYGAEKSVQREHALDLLSELLSILPVAPLDADVGEHYGFIRSDLERRGMMIGNNDLWIAAHALSLGAILVSNNEREFRRVSELKIENWTHD
jgi:tRNA(fMet)-specific endonuclease VapC